MTTRAPLRVLRIVVASALAAFCLWRGIAAASAYFTSADAYAYIAAWRSAARSAPGERLAVFCGNADCLSPVDRSRILAVSWERAPSPLAAVDGKSDLKSVDCVISSYWHPRQAAERLENCGFSVVSTNEYTKTWRRGGTTVPEPSGPGSAVSPYREVASLVAELALYLVCCRFLLCLKPGEGGWAALVSSVVVAVVLGSVALSHPLLAPNGLGTYGGKAKLLFESGSIPGEFLASAGGMALQPSYPPALTALAYVHFALSGGCSDRLVQMIVVFAMAILSFAMLRKASTPWLAVPVALFCLSPVAARMASGFYAEPFAALALLLGWRIATEGRLAAGSLVMGLAGLFRPEAGIVAAFFAAGSASCGFRRKLLAVAAAASPSLAWFAASMALGYGAVPDWSLGAGPRLGQAAIAMLVEAKAFGLFVMPIAALALLVRPRLEMRLLGGAARALFPAVLLMAAIPFACAFYAGPHAAWMMENTIPRLVWYVFAIPLFELARGRE